MRLWDVILQVPLLLEPSVTKVALQISGVNFFPSVKILHTWNGRSPVWLNMCTLNVVYRPNCFPHSLHGKFFSPRCITLMCKSMALFKLVYDSKHSIYDSKYSICFPDESKQCPRWKIICAWRTCSWVSSRLEKFEGLLEARFTNCTRVSNWHTSRTLLRGKSWAPWKGEPDWISQRRLVCFLVGPCSRQN